MVNNMVKVVCAQFESKKGEIDYNLHKIGYFFDQTKNLKPDIIIFPELCVQGLCDSATFSKIVDKLPNYSTEFISKLCKKYSCYSIFGIAEKDEKDIYNSSVLISPCGKIIGTYRKVHLWDKENNYFSRGKNYNNYLTYFGNIGIWICYDTRFPEVARIYGINGARISFISSAWKARDTEHFKLAIRSRALDNFMYICAADSIAHDHLHHSVGSSLICGPDGKIICEAERNKECFIWANIELKLSDNLRNKIPIFKDRQKTTYIDLAK
jgi:predicted amidohydrolase